MRQLKLHLQAFLFLVLCIYSTGVSAQQKFSDNLFIESNYGIGFILPEYQFINYVVEDFARSFELSFFKQTTGKSDWEQIYNYPSYGVRFLYSDLGSPDVLGQNIGLYPYYHLKVIDLNRISMFHEAGLGFSYVTKKFDLEDNFLNVAIGSHLNFHLNIRFGLNYELTEKLHFRTGLSLDHFSNANTAEPNLGINYLTWNSGLSFALGAITERKQIDLDPKVKSIEQEFVYNIGGKHTRELSSKYYLTNSISYEIRKKYFRAYHLGLGADLFYDSSVKDQLEENNKAFKSQNNFQSGIHFSQSLVYDRFSFTLLQGLYLGFAEKVENHTLYNKGIIKYFITEHISARISMKSHLHILDYPEFGLGIKL